MIPNEFERIFYHIFQNDETGHLLFQPNSYTLKLEQKKTPESLPIDFLVSTEQINNI